MAHSRDGHFGMCDRSALRYVIGDAVINTFSSPEQFAKIKEKMDAQGFWLVLSLGVVPIPFQIAMLAAGATKYSLVLFIIATTIARSIRYFGIALIVYYAGDQAERIIRENKTKTAVIVTLLVFLAWLLSALL